MQIKFEASLPSGNWLRFDSHGSARIIFETAGSELAKVASTLQLLKEKTFIVIIETEPEPTPGPKDDDHGVY